MAKLPLATPEAVKAETKLVRSRLGPLVGNLELPGYKGVLQAWILGSGGPDALALARDTYRVQVREAPAVVDRGRKFWLSTS